MMNNKNGGRYDLHFYYSVFLFELLQSEIAVIKLTITINQLNTVNDIDLTRVAAIITPITPPITKP